MGEDYGFEFPDVRDEYIAKSGEEITVRIERDYRRGGDYYDLEDDDITFDIHFDTCIDGKPRVSLPIGVSQEKAEKTARLLYPEDREASKSMYDVRSIERQERERGA